MAEKRRLSARERREPAAKRRASEATPQAQSQAQQKKKASTPVFAPSPPPPPPESVQKPLPTKIKDGDALPTVPSPQPDNLSSNEYQSIAESAILLASLERSKKKWLSDGILVRYWTKPKKTKREQIEGKNPPKESMSKIGPCNIVVGPHLFDGMLYTVKDPNAPPPIQYTPPQRPMVHYGHPNNFQQYQPYPPQPPPPQHARQHPPQTPPAHTASPQPGPPQGGHPPPQPPARTPNNPPHRSTPTPQSAQRPSPSQNPQAPQPPKPSPDPVIQMLATRAASDPDLKALMRVVASSKASQEQLRAFQAHIDELNAIIRAREQRQQQAQQSHPPTPNQAQASPRTPQQTPQSQKVPPQPQQQPGQQHQQNPQPQSQPHSQHQATPQSQPPVQPRPQEQPLPRVEVQIPKPPQSLTSTPQASKSTNSKTPTSQKSNSTPQVKQEPGVASSHPPPTHQTTVVEIHNKRPMPPPQQQGTGQRQGPQYPPYQGHPPAIQSRPPQYGSPTPYYRPAPPPPPPRLNYKSVVFEFTSPLTPYGSSTSGHAGSGDRYLFPEYSILEWLPGGNTILASFLVVRKVDPNAPFPIETASDTGNSRAKGKSGSKSKKGDKNKAKEKEKEEKEKEQEKGKDQEGKQEKSTPQPAPNPESSTATETKPTPAEGDKPAGDQKDQPAATPNKADTEKQAKAKTEDAKNTTNLKEYYQPVTFRIHSPNPKVLEPLSRVVKPPDEVRKYMNEIMDRAERAADGFLAFRLPREDIGDAPETEDHKKGGTPVPGIRSRLSRSKAVGDESDTENTDFAEEEEEEEVLQDYYGPPTGFTFMGTSS